MEALSNWVLSVEGTPAAGNIAILLAFVSALCHAIFGVLQKTKEDPFLIRAAIDFWFFIIWLPIALLFVPLPNSHEWLLISGIFPIHTLYKLVLTGAYRNGEFTVIYPIARGSAPMFTGLAAGVFFGEYLTPLQWAGVLLISTMIMTMSWESMHRIKVNRDKLPRAIAFAVATGFMIMVYSIYDAHGVRESRSPFTFLAWFYIVDGFLFPLIAIVFANKFVPKTSYSALLTRGLIAAPLGIVSFAAVFVASRIGHVGEVTAIRETSVIFATLMGYFFLREQVTKLRFVLIVLIVIGALLVKIGG